MKNINTPLIGEKANLTPMIDIVFLLLIFFMVTTSLIKEEAELEIQLPTPTTPKQPPEMSSKHIIDIMPNGSVYLNGGLVHASPESRIVEQLAKTLGRLKASSDRMEMNTIILVQADPASPHYKSMEVLDSCAASGINYVSFSKL